jgi:hypothetical protein
MSRLPLWSSVLVLLGEYGFLYGVLYKDNSNSASSSGGLGFENWPEVSYLTGLRILLTPYRQVTVTTTCSPLSNSLFSIIFQRYFTYSLKRLTHVNQEPVN